MIPSEIMQGDTVSWYDSAFSDPVEGSISPSEWTLETIISNGDDKITITATEAEGRWLSVIANTVSDDLSPGVHYWHTHVKKTGKRITIGAGQFTVKADLSASDDPAAFDSRSQAKKDLDAVQSAIRAMISGGAIAEYTIGTRSIKKMSLSDLYTMESRLKFQVSQEEKANAIANGLGNPNSLYVRFK